MRMLRFFTWAIAGALLAFAGPLLGQNSNNCGQAATSRTFPAPGKVRYSTGLTCDQIVDTVAVTDTIALKQLQKALADSSAKLVAVIATRDATIVSLNKTIDSLRATPAPQPTPTPQPDPTPTPPPPAGTESFYFHSKEAGCGSDANVLLCDDFEDGDWYTKNCDQANASGGLDQTDGWCGTISNDAGLRDGTARCGSMGFKSNCAATSGFKNNGANGHNATTGNMADHVLAGGGAGEIWVRFYTKPLTGYTFGQEKWLTFNAGGAGSGGIRWGNLMWGCGQGGDVSTSTTGFAMVNLNFAPLNASCQPTASSGQRYAMTGGNWYFVEVHFKLNTPGASDGIFEFWIDNCGPSGTTCPSTPTLRYRVTTYTSDRAAGETIKTLWFETYGNDPKSTGERLIDQIKVSKVGPIGFMK